LVERFLYAVTDYGDCNFIFYAAGDDDIGNFALRLDVAKEVGLDKCEPLLYAAFDVAAAVFCISQY